MELNDIPVDTFSGLLVRLSKFICGRCILHIHWTDFVSNDVVRSHMGQPLLSGTIRQRRLSFIGHLCRADTGQDHSRALRACIRGPPKDWRRRNGSPRQSWLRTVDDACSTLAWRWQDGMLWIDWHGVYSWMRLHPRDTLQRERGGGLSPKPRF